MMALSWSVASVCSSRPSEPSAIQHRLVEAMPAAAVSNSITRSVNRSLSVEMIRVSWSAGTPWARRLRASARTSRPAATSASRLAAERRVALTALSPIRCKANRSLSDTIPTGRPASTSAMWWKPWCAMVSAAEMAIASAGSVTGSRVITPDTAAPTS